MDPSETVTVFASFDPKPGQEERVLEILETMVEHTRAEPGNEAYDLYSSDHPETGGRRYHLFERYRDEDALEAHRRFDHYREYRSVIGDLISHPVDVLVLAPIDARV